MSVRELVGGNVISISPNETVRVAATTMASEEVGALAVMDKGRLVGIFTERDLVHACADDADVDMAVVSEWMTAEPDSLDPEMPVQDAADWMLAAGYRHLPIVDGVNVVGMVSIKDVLWGLTGPSV